MFPHLQTRMQNASYITAWLTETDNIQTSRKRVLSVEVKRFLPMLPSSTPEIVVIQL
jgi:hypothetical protein